MTDLQDFCLRWSSYSQQLSEALRTLLDRELLVDVTLACDGRSLRAHRAVLSACSTYFQDLFQESTHPHPIVILKDVRYQELEALVKFMYHGEVTVNHDTLPGFLRTAEMLHIRGLTDDALHGHASAANHSKILNCTRRSVVEGHFSSSTEGNTTPNQSVSPIAPKRIKLEQPHLPHFARSSRAQQHHQDVERCSSSNSGGDETNLPEQQDSRCIIRSEDLSQLNHDQYNFQRSMTLLDGLSQLVMPVLQDDDPQNNHFVTGMCQNIPSHQQHTSPQQSMQHQPYHSQQSNSNNSNGSGSNSTSRPFRQRVLYNQEQLLQLEAWYRQDRYPSGALMKEYADTLAAMVPNTPGSLGAQPMRQNVDYWFQNRRRKDFHPEVMQQREKKKLAKSLWGSYNSNNVSGGAVPNSGNSAPNAQLESNNSSSNNSHYDCSSESNQDCSILIPKPDFSPEILNPNRH